jgi:HlyD family secretion protein
MSGSQFDIPSLSVSAAPEAPVDSPRVPVPRAPDPRDALTLPDQVAGKRRGRTLWLLLLGGAVVLAAVYFIFWSRQGPNNPYRISPVEVRSIRQTVEAFGSLDVVGRVFVPAPRPGQLSEVYARRGTTVDANAPLAKLDASFATAELSAAKTALSASAARVERARTARASATEERTRAERLLGRGLVSAASVAAAKANEQEAIAALRTAEAQRELDQQSASGAKVRRDETTLRAPVSGFVLSATEDLGAMVGPQTGPLFVISPPLTELMLTVPISEADIGLVRIGQGAVFTVSAYPDRRFPAKVGEIESEPQRNGSSVSYRVRLRVQNPDGVLRPGMTTNVTLEIAEANEALAVREAALRFTPADAPSEAGEPQRSRVWRQRTGGDLEPVEVVVGISDGAYTAVTLAAGAELAPGDMVAVGYAGSATRSSTKGPGISLGSKP